MSLIPIDGSPLQIMPGQGSVEFTVEGETWSVPIIGYAVVVIHIGSSTSIRGEHVEYETQVEPLIIDPEGYVRPLDQYRRYDIGAPAGLKWRVIPG